MRRQPAPNERRPETIATGEPVRCAFCGALLATTERAGLRIQRSGLEVLVAGTTRASFVCYGCRRLNTIEMAGRSNAPGEPEEKSSSGSTGVSHLAP